MAVLLPELPNVTPKPAAGVMETAPPIAILVDELLGALMTSALPAGEDMERSPPLRKVVRLPSIFNCGVTMVVSFPGCTDAPLLICIAEEVPDVEMAIVPSFPAANSSCP